mgnify:CR=1 FL=1
MAVSVGGFPAAVALFLIVSCSLPMGAGLGHEGEPPATGRAQNQAPVPDQQAAPRLFITEAMMCEKVENLTPVRPAVLFPVALGQVYCYTSFDKVPAPTMIYHRWYHRDELSTQTRLRLYPPKWATYSVVQLRETDKGPWRVEISDQTGLVIGVLRFSIGD